MELQRSANKPSLQSMRSWSQFLFLSEIQLILVSLCFAVIESADESTIVLIS